MARSMHSFVRCAASLAAALRDCDAPILLSAQSFAAIAPAALTPVDGYTLIIWVRAPDPVPWAESHVQRFTDTLRARGIEEVARCNGARGRGQDRVSAILFRTPYILELNDDFYGVPLNQDGEPGSAPPGSTPAFGDIYAGAHMANLGRLMRLNELLADGFPLPPPQPPTPLEHPVAMFPAPPLPRDPSTISPISEFEDEPAERTAVPLCPAEAAVLSSWWTARIADSEEMTQLHRMPCSGTSRWAVAAWPRLRELVASGLLKREVYEAQLVEARRARGLRPRSD